MKEIDIIKDLCYTIRNRGKATASFIVRSMMPQLKDKRRFSRTKSRLLLRYHVAGTPEYNYATVEDVSEGGLGFVNKKFIAPETQLSLQITLGLRILTPTAKAVWSSPLPHSYRYKVGLEFIGINPSDKQLLSDFIDMQTGNTQ
ncbi:MAG: PilZ domain-containing protein [Candidatus Omnitrophica bacterium]|nr:PilZ domain-containing protein [Candidatus Omnitrophota bacterium]